MQNAGSRVIFGGLPLATAALALAIFIADTVTNIEISFSVFYVLTVLMASRFCEPSGIILVTAGCVALTLISYIITPPGGAPIGGIVNTVISAATIVLTAALVLKDQTRETLRQELAKRAAELEAANKELELFAYSVSHDLRAPLRHIFGYAELLQKQAFSSLDDKSQRYIKTIQDASKRMGNLIDDLLAFSRVGRAETRKAVVNLEQLVKEVVAELGQDTVGRVIVWKIGALQTCYGDRSLLKLVLTNLISNAIKYTRVRSRAEIEIGCANKNGSEVEVFVRDNGAGFDMRYVDKLSEYFSACIRPRNLRGPASDWPPFSASSIATVAPCGPRERWTAVRPSIFQFQEPTSGGKREQIRTYFVGGRRPKGPRAHLNGIGGIQTGQ